MIRSTLLARCQSKSFACKRNGLLTHERLEHRLLLRGQGQRDDARFIAHQKLVGGAAEAFGMAWCCCRGGGVGPRKAPLNSSTSATSSSTVQATHVSASEMKALRRITIRDRPQCRTRKPSCAESG